MEVGRIKTVPALGVGFPDGRGMVLRGLPYSLRLDSSLVLDLPHLEGAGALVSDISPYHQDMGAVGWPVPAVPGWYFLPGGQPAIAYDGAHNYMSSSAPALNFTSQDFTLLIWCGSTLPGGSYMLMTQGKVDVCGWEFYLSGGVNTISLRTNQAGSHTGISAIGGFIPSVTLPIWQLVGVTRRRAGGQFYVNGEPVATTLGAGLLDPVSGAGHQLLVGKGELGNYFLGAISITRIWARELSEAEMASIFESERSLFGV